MAVGGQRQQVDRLLDVAVFAPLGLALTVCDRVQNRVRVARFIGEMAVRYGRAEYDRQVAERHRAQTAAMSPIEPVAVSGAVDQPAPASSHVQPAPVEVPRPDALPIGDYESLAAIHVVERLGTLRPDEVEQIRRFESAHRARRTILAKIGQLQDAGT